MTYYITAVVYVKCHSACPSTQLSDWDNAVIKQAGVEVGRVRVRGAQKTDVKIQTTMRLDVDILAAFKANGRGWQTRMNDALRDWLKHHPAP